MALLWLSPLASPTKLVRKPNSGLSCDKKDIDFYVDVPMETFVILKSAQVLTMLYQSPPGNKVDFWFSVILHTV